MVLRPSVWRHKKHCIIILRRYRSALSVPCWERRIFISTINTKNSKYMNNEISGAYEAPKVEIIEVAVERGFANSVNVWGNGGNLGDYETE